MLNRIIMKESNKTKMKLKKDIKNNNKSRYLGFLINEIVVH